MTTLFTKCDKPMMAVSFCSTIFAQVDIDSIEGTIRDLSGVVVPTTLT
jgi:hypothetical protein